MWCLQDPTGIGFKVFWVADLQIYVIYVSIEFLTFAGHFVSFQNCKTKPSPAGRVKNFHFSGQWLQPWWYIHLSPQDAKQLIQTQHAYRDPRGMVALAVEEWLLAVAWLKIQPSQLLVGQE